MFRKKEEPKIRITGEIYPVMLTEIKKVTMLLKLTGNSRGIFKAELLYSPVFKMKNLFFKVCQTT